MTNAQPSQVEKRTVSPKRSKWLAGALSIVPGIGQIYAGQVKRGVFLLLGLPIQGLILRLVGAPALAAWLAIVWIWNIWDAWSLAAGRRRSLNIPIFVLILANFAAGWKVTAIDVPAFLSNFPRMRNIALDLLQPKLIERATETRVGRSDLIVGDFPAGTSLMHAKSGEPAIRLSPPRARLGQSVRVGGTGFLPGVQGTLVLLAGGEREVATFRADRHGTFETAFVVPLSSSGKYLLEAKTSRSLNRWQITETLRLTSRLMLETIFLALMGTAISLVITLPLSFFGARNLMTGSAAGTMIYGATRTLFNVLRSVEVLIIAVMMVAVVGIGPFAGVIALAIHGIGALGKLYSEAIESIEPGPMEAVASTGATKLQVVMYGVLPQVVPQFVAFTIYRWDINVRMATIIGLVGGGGIGYILTQYIQVLQWRDAGTAIWLIAAVVMLMDYVSAVVREKIG